MTSKQKNKKILFISACYLLLAVLLVVLFTLAKYIKVVEGETYLPEVKTFTASIELGGSSVVTGTTVENLLTGYDVSYENGMSFTVYNTDDADKLTQTGISYTIKVFSEGNLPLEISLFVEDENKDMTEYIGYRSLASTDTLGDGYQYDFYSLDGELAQFQMGNDETESQAFILGFGWSEDVVYTDNSSTEIYPGVISSHGDYEKEIDLIEIRAIVTGDDAKDEYEE